MRFSTWVRTLFAQPRRTRQRQSSLRRGLEKLEDRAVPTVGYRSYDGAGNNTHHTSWGTAGADLIRLSPAQYGDRISTPAGATRPSARAISNAVVAHGQGEIQNDRLMSNFVYQWGQFIDHDLDLTSTANLPVAFNVAVPTGDPQFDPNSTGTQVIRLNRSNYDPATGTSPNRPRQQINDITAYLDGSMVYGSDEFRATALRTMSGGRLKTSAGNLMPFNTDELPNANDPHLLAESSLFVGGDVRANENVELTAVHTLFVREHNRLADQFAAAHPNWDDEHIYQEARRWVIAEIEAITFNEFLPALLGRNAIQPYRGYNPNVNPGIANEFSAAAFRFGHSMLGNDVEFLDDEGYEVEDGIPLSQAFFNPEPIIEMGIDPLLKYLASDKAEEIDTRVVDSLRNFLFGQPGQGGFDLASLNIQRGRDHGLADYNTVRAYYGLPRVTSFAQITGDPELRQQLQELYGTVNNVDLWVGGLAERHLPGSSLGPTFTRIVANQFERLRDGDRFWYQRDFSGSDLRAIQDTTLADVIRRNTTLVNLQDNVFYFRASIGGRVFADANRDGTAQWFERGIGGRTIELLNENGAVVATAVTTRNGSYSFSALDLGSYTVREVVPDGVRLTTPESYNVRIGRGMDVGRRDFGEARHGGGHGELPERQLHAQTPDSPQFQWFESKDDDSLVDLVGSKHR